jgi:hypothetical protein
MTNDVKRARANGEWTNDEFDKVTDIGTYTFKRVLDPLEVESNDVIQLTAGPWIGCYAVIDGVERWGVRAMMIGPAPQGRETAHFPVRVPFGEFIFIGKNWSPRDGRQNP